jgi:hypothetical protein
MGRIYDTCFLKYSVCMVRVVVIFFHLRSSHCEHLVVLIIKKLEGTKEGELQ